MTRKFRAQIENFEGKGNSLFFKKNRARKNDSIELGSLLNDYCPVSSATAR
jgi:hypothetical protein